MSSAPNLPSKSPSKPKPSRCEFAGVYHAIVPDPTIRYGWRAVALFVRPDGSMRMETSPREQPRDLILAEVVASLEDMADRLFRQVQRFRIAEHSARADAGRLVLAADGEQKALASFAEELELVKKREADARTSAAAPNTAPVDRPRYEAMAEVYRQDGETVAASMKKLEEAIEEKEKAYNTLLNTARKCVLAAEAAEAALFL